MVVCKQCKKWGEEGEGERGGEEKEERGGEGVGVAGDDGGGKCGGERRNKGGRGSAVRVVGYSFDIFTR